MPSSFGYSDIEWHLIFRKRATKTIIHSSRSDRTWNTVHRSYQLLPKHISRSLIDVIQTKAARIIYRVPRDAHADLLLSFLNLADLRDRRETHLIKLIKSFVSGRCHPAMPSFIKLRTDKTLVMSQSRSILWVNDDLQLLVLPSTTSI